MSGFGRGRPENDGRKQHFAVANTIQKTTGFEGHREDSGTKSYFIDRQNSLLKSQSGLNNESDREISSFNTFSTGSVSSRDGNSSNRDFGSKSRYGNFDRSGGGFRGDSFGSGRTGVATDKDGWRNSDNNSGFDRGSRFGENQTGGSSVYDGENRSGSGSHSDSLGGRGGGAGFGGRGSSFGGRGSGFGGRSATLGGRGSSARSGFDGGTNEDNKNVLESRSVNFDGEGDSSGFNGRGGSFSGRGSNFGGRGNSVGRCDNFGSRNGGYKSFDSGASEDSGHHNITSGSSRGFGRRSISYGSGAFSGSRNDVDSNTNDFNWNSSENRNAGCGGEGSGRDISFSGRSDTFSSRGDRGCFDSDVNENDRINSENRNVSFRGESSAHGSSFRGRGCAVSGRGSRFGDRSSGRNGFNCGSDKEDCNVLENRNLNIDGEGGGLDGSFSGRGSSFSGRGSSFSGRGSSFSGRANNNDGRISSIGGRGSGFGNRNFDRNYSHIGNNEDDWNDIEKNNAIFNDGVDNGFGSRVNSVTGRGVTFNNGSSSFDGRSSGRSGFDGGASGGGWDLQNRNNRSSGRGDNFGSSGNNMEGHCGYDRGLDEEVCNVSENFNGDNGAGRSSFGDYQHNRRDGLGKQNILGFGRGYGGRYVRSDRGSDDDFENDRKNKFDGRKFSEKRNGFRSNFDVENSSSLSRSRSRGGFASETGTFGDGSSDRFGKFGDHDAFDSQRNFGGHRRFEDLNSGRTSTRKGSSSPPRMEFERKRAATHIPEDRSLEEMYREDADNAKYELSDLDQEVTVTGVPLMQKLLKLDDWSHAGFSELLLRNVVEKSHYKIPRRIQAAVVPLIQNGWDLLGQAETGTGKTAAFILPIINYISTRGEPKGSRGAPIALIVAPTRELVLQLYDQTRKFADGTGVTVAKAYGQYRISSNVSELERGCNILFATVGRLKDFVERGKVKLHNIKFFVLDEADRMLEKVNFCKEVMDLIQYPGFPTVDKRQTLLFSATYTPEIQDLAAKVLKQDHAFVSNGKTTAANPLVEQNFLMVTCDAKLNKLYELLQEDRENNGEISRTLVFVQQKQMADIVALNLVQRGIPSSSINGDREQKQREDAMRDFRRGVVRVLVATDVCARGIDVKDLEHVINYDMPDTPVTYVHRIGRTGRLHRGKATSFIDLEYDKALVADIVKVVREVQQIPPDFMVEFVQGFNKLAVTESCDRDESVSGNQSGNLNRNERSTSSDKGQQEADTEK